jgi:dihydrofolate reductase
MAVRVDLNISLDGFATTTDQTPEKPFGDDWSRLVDAYVATRTFRSRVLHDASGQGTTGVDEKYAQEYFVDVGAEIMGAGMFGLHNFPDDPDWRGWWGEEPPYHGPVFVLTHWARAPVEMRGGTTFFFVTDGVDSALAQARAAAGRRNISIAGGASTVRQFLAAGHIDELRLHIAPLVLGAGERPFEGVHALRLEQAECTSSELVTHISYRVLR